MVYPDKTFRRILHSKGQLLPRMQKVLFTRVVQGKPRQTFPDKFSLPSKTQNEDESKRTLIVLFCTATREYRGNNGVLLPLIIAQKQQYLNFQSVKYPVKHAPLEKSQNNLLFLVNNHIIPGLASILVYIYPSFSACERRNIGSGY